MKIADAYLIDAIPSLIENQTFLLLFAIYILGQKFSYPATQVSLSHAVFSVDGKNNDRKKERKKVLGRQ